MKEDVIKDVQNGILYPVRYPSGQYELVFDSLTPVNTISAASTGCVTKLLSNMLAVAEYVETRTLP
jgi:hypothetical protein